MIFHEAVASDLLKNPKLNGGNTIAIVEAKKMLARACEFTLTVEPLWLGSGLSQNRHPGRHYKTFFMFRFCGFHKGQDFLYLVDVRSNCLSYRADMRRSIP
jgi:hypothetical protein